MITRRESIVAMGVAALFPRTVFGQQATKIIRVGYLGPTTAAASYTSRWQGFQDEMRALGYQSGRNIAYQVLWANNDATRLPELAAELVRSNVDLILTNGTPAVLAMKRATSTIPGEPPLVNLETPGNRLSTNGGLRSPHLGARCPI